MYIGKATNIKDRVKSHFLQPTFRDSLFVDRVSRIGYVKTDSEIEALLLEAKQIKRHQPKYNVMWRDDKNYFFVAITKEKFPRIFITHQTKDKKTEYIGPFVDGQALKQTLKILRKVFPYRSCISLPSKPCLWHQLKRCPAPCLTRKKISKEIPTLEKSLKKELIKNSKNIAKVLKGGKTQVLKSLKLEMESFSKNHEFEKAAKRRDQIRVLERILAHARVFETPNPQQNLWQKTETMVKSLVNVKTNISRIEAYDVSNIQGKLATGSLVTFINGQPDKSFYRKFKIKIAGKPNDIAMLKEVLTRRFLHSEWPFPDLILIDGGKAQLNIAIAVAKQHKIKAKVTALAKANNELFIENNKSPVLLKNQPREIFNLFLQLRDEAHRFAIIYHKKLRKVDLLGQN